MFLARVLVGFWLLSLAAWSLFVVCGVMTASGQAAEKVIEDSSKWGASLLGLHAMRSFGFSGMFSASHPAPHVEALPWISSVKVLGFALSLRELCGSALWSWAMEAAVSSFTALL